MKIEYSKQADALYIYLKEAYVKRSREIEDGIVIDLDENGHLIGIEVLGVSEKLSPKELANISIENIPVEMAV
ncbi:MAG: DUF2283 domain-containing protein [bacterium]